MSRGLNSIARRLVELSDDPDIVYAQYAVMKRQVPLLYLVLIITALAVYYLYYDIVPSWLLASVTVVFVGTSSVRFIYWSWFLPSADDLDLAQVHNALRRTALAVIPISVAYLGYAFVLDQYGGPFERAALAVCVVLTAIGCIFCLIHLPQAARLVHLVIIPPYALYHLWSDNSAFILISVNAAIVTTLMIRVSQNVYEGFTELVTSRSKLAVQQSEAERLAAENARLAMTDALTGMPNRRVFLERMEACVEQSERSGEPFVVGVLDLDRFKPVNDIYGHAIGDQLLVEVGKRLQSLETERLLVARLGGDEFGIVMNEGPAAADALGQQVLDLVTRPVRFNGHSFSLGCSIGFASFPEAGRKASDLFDRADYALYHVKSQGRGGYTFFTHELEKRLRSETEIETELQNADLERELTVELQPIICLTSARVVGMEALGRWESAVIGKVEPIHFIEAAERLNMMEAITTTLFEKLLRSIDSLPEEHELSFNLSTHDIVTSSTIDLLLAAIARSGVMPERITFEITETSLMRDFDTATENIRRLRALGVSIALDDFGTGYSSLSYLNRLPIDKVKIDRSFVHDFDQSGDTKVMSAILSMCRTLNLECIVEGVETEQQLHTLVDLGCSMAQGYLFARPMKVDALQTWLAQPEAIALPLSATRGLLGQPEYRRLFGS